MQERLDATGPCVGSRGQGDGGGGNSPSGARWTAWRHWRQRIRWYPTVAPATSPSVVTLSTASETRGLQAHGTQTRADRLPLRTRRSARASKLLSPAILGDASHSSCHARASLSGLSSTTLTFLIISSSCGTGAIQNFLPFTLQRSFSLCSISTLS